MAMGREWPSPCPGRENACLRVGSINVNDQSVLKRRQLVERFEEIRLNVMGVKETHINDRGVIGCMMGSESEV